MQTSLIEHALMCRAYLKNYWSHKTLQEYYVCMGNSAPGVLFVGLTIHAELWPLKSFYNKLQSIQLVMALFPSVIVCFMTFSTWSYITATVHFFHDLWVKKPSYWQGNVPCPSAPHHNRGSLWGCLVPNPWSKPLGHCWFPPCLKWIAKQDFSLSLFPHTTNQQQTTLKTFRHYFL